MNNNEASTTIALSGPEQVAAFQLLRVRAGLALEIKTGMKMSRHGSVMNLAASYCGSTKRTKAAVYKEYDAYLVSLGFESKPLP